MKGQLSEADKLRRYRGQKLQQRIMFEAMPDEQRLELITERERLNAEIERLEGKK